MKRFIAKCCITTFSAEKDDLKFIAFKPTLLVGEKLIIHRADVYERSVTSKKYLYLRF